MRLSPKFAARPVYWAYRAWCASLCYTEINRAAIEGCTRQGKPVVLGLWHDELFPLIYLKRDLEMIAVVSRSYDGDILSWVLSGMGLETARGSSSRGGLGALLEAKRRMREANLGVCITVDGPRGPRHKVKPGAVFLATLFKVPIVPIRMFMERAKVFNSWDRFQLPLPFSRVSMVCGDAYYPQADRRDAEGMEQECRELQARLEGLQP